jgi:hypothetical protein
MASKVFCCCLQSEAEQNEERCAPQSHGQNIEGNFIVYVLLYDRALCGHCVVVNLSR